MVLALGYRSVRACFILKRSSPAIDPERILERDHPPDLPLALAKFFPNVTGTVGLKPASPTCGHGCLEPLCA